ncbi:heat shock factor protein 1-like [Clavelina lepadiformis]|uniref:heat shock factor protein 1-like n=1 Tax=Clavelina lepadiformis TaxID=159417 RepID=UPI004041483E
MMKKQPLDKAPSITPAGYGNTIPTFLLKLLNLLQEPEFHDSVSWNKDGTSFIVHDQANFAKNVLPKYFKHNKFASFVRQLNMYGFRKVTTITQGSLTAHQEAIEFHHPCFLRDDQSSLLSIKRKVTQTSNKQSLDDVGQLLDEMHDIKDSQFSISNTLTELKQENEDLWREVVSLRQKHARQQKVVNHLIKFLVSLVQHHGMGVKRRLPLMIDDGSGTSEAKVSRPGETTDLDAPTSPSAFIDEDNISDGPFITELLSSKFSSDPSGGHTILGERNVTSDGQPSNNTNFDISDLIQYNEVSSQKSQGKTMTLNSPVTSNSTENMSNAIALPNRSNLELPSVSPLEEDHDDSDLVDNFINSLTDGSTVITTPDVSTTPSNQQVAIPSSPKLFKDVEKINASMDSIQSNLQTLQQRISNNQQLKLDYDLIQELFNGSVDITPSPQILDPSLSIPVTRPQAAGNELVQYNSKLLTDLTADGNEDPNADLLKLLQQ